MLLLVKRGFPLHDGSSVVLYSTQHLEHDNPFRDLRLDAIVDRLAHLGITHPNWIHAPAVLGIALLYAHLSDAAFDPRYADEIRQHADPCYLYKPTQTLLVLAIALGHRIGLSSGWIQPETADLVWAGAAKVLRALDVDHPNDVDPGLYHGLVLPGAHIPVLAHPVRPSAR